MNSTLETTLQSVLTLTTRTVPRMNDNCTKYLLVRPLTATYVDYIIQHYIFPIQFIFGVSGNTLNLLVLLSSSMKNQANTLLSAMAFADLAFLFCMVPFSLASFEFFYTSWKFKTFFYYYKAHGTTVANLFSTAATWLVLAVSIERFSGVRRPMHARFQLRDFRLCALIGIIFFAAVLLTLHQHFEYSIYFKYDPYCNIWFPHLDLHNSQKQNINSWLYNFITVSKYLQLTVGVTIPVLAVAVLNVSLIYYVRRREIKTRAKGNDKDRRTSDFGNFQKQERRVTITVLSIVSCFTITHLPSLAPYCYELFREIYKPGEFFNNSITILNNILVSGKVLNFVLFCMSSAHFRRRTMIMLNSWCTNRRKKYSSMASSSFHKQQNVRLNQFRQQKSMPKMSSISTQGIHSETFETCVPEKSTAFSVL